MGLKICLIRVKKASILTGAGRGWKQSSDFAHGGGDGIAGKAGGFNPADLAGGRKIDLHPDE